MYPVNAYDQTHEGVFGLQPPSEWKSELGRGMNCGVRSGQALAPLRGRETSGDAPSRFLGVAFRFVFARDNVGVASGWRSATNTKRSRNWNSQFSPNVF